MKAARFLSVAAMVFTTFIWGISFSSNKVLLKSLAPAEIALLRLVLAVAVLGLAFWITRRRGVARMARTDLPRLAAGGFAGVFLYFVFQNHGLNYTTAGAASLVASTVPVLNVIAGRAFFQERYASRQWAGVVLSMIGVFGIVYFGESGLALAKVQGNLLIFGAACSWVAFTRINEPLTRRYSNLTLTFYQSLAGMFFLGLLALPGGISIHALNLPVVLNLAFLGLFCSAAAFFLYLTALKSLGSTTTTTFLNLVPVFGVFGAMVLLQETLAGGQIAGAALVLLGVSLVTTESIKKVKKVRCQAP